MSLTEFVRMRQHGMKFSEYWICMFFVRNLLLLESLLSGITFVHVSILVLHSLMGQSVDLDVDVNADVEVKNVDSILRQFREEFVHIVPGQSMFTSSFVMGGERPEEQPRRTVTLKYSFEMAKYEVWQDVWQAIMGSNPARWKGRRNAVEMVSHPEAMEFCRRVTDRLRALGLIRESQVVRLPTEAEWEYCARAGATGQYSFGDDAAKLGEYAWYQGNAAGNDPPVGAKLPNAWGLYDMHGYVWEWCLDVAHDDYHGAPCDGSPWMEGGVATRRVLRGGSWKDPAEALRCATRAGAFVHRKIDTGEQILYKFVGGADENLRDDAVGFRCVIAAQDVHAQKK